MDATPTFSLKQAALGDLDAELSFTRRVLERLPAEHLGWRPHEKSWTLGELAHHLANLLTWQSAIVAHDGFDLDRAPAPGAPPESRQALLDAFDRGAAAFRAALDAMDEAALARPWTLRRGDFELFTLPRATVLRMMGLSHMAHHRGQLTVYLRLLDVPVPALYGPSADEGPM